MFPDIPSNVTPQTITSRGINCVVGELGQPNPGDSILLAHGTAQGLANLFKDTVCMFLAGVDKQPIELI